MVFLHISQNVKRRRNPCFGGFFDLNSPQILTFWVLTNTLSNDILSSTEQNNTNGETTMARRKSKFTTTTKPMSIREQVMDAIGKIAKFQTLHGEYHLVYAFGTNDLVEQPLLPPVQLGAQNAAVVVIRGSSYIAIATGKNKGLWRKVYS